MKTITLLLALLFALPTLVIAAEVKADQKEATPKQALEAFKKALKAKDVEAARRHIVLYDILPERSIKEFKRHINDLIELHQNGWDFTLLEEKIEGDCAVIIINESKKNGKASFDIDPVYLLRQDGQWKVFVNMSSYRLAVEADQTKEPTFLLLKDWYKNRKAELKAQHKAKP
ncbi:hypothetical protein Rhal01_01308 [Rubritalea halochordaticola]|uniref:Nuclear transport factor 2 family protein n=1 Tax=Rubritalea halochordaticola TaxID=714537 RepID=A0ABP9UXE8_9BACT